MVQQLAHDSQRADLGPGRVNGLLLAGHSGHAHRQALIVHAVKGPGKRLQQGLQLGQGQLGQALDLIGVKKVGQVDHRHRGIAVGRLGKEQHRRAELPVKAPAQQQAIRTSPQGGKEGAGERAAGRRRIQGAACRRHVRRLRITQITHGIERKVVHLFQAAQGGHLVGTQPTVALRGSQRRILEGIGRSHGAWGGQRRLVGAGGGRQGVRGCRNRRRRCRKGS